MLTENHVLEEIHISACANIFPVSLFPVWANPQKCFAAKLQVFLKPQGTEKKLFNSESKQLFFIWFEWFFRSFSRIYFHPTAPTLNVNVSQLFPKVYLLTILGITKKKDEFPSAPLNKERELNVSCSFNENVFRLFRSLFRAIIRGMKKTKATTWRHFCGLRTKKFWWMLLVNQWFTNCVTRKILRRQIKNKSK